MIDCHMAGIITVGGNHVRYHRSPILLYQTIEDLVEAVTRKGAHTIDRLSMPYLDGWYVTGDINEMRMRVPENHRSEERVGTKAPGSISLSGCQGEYDEHE